MTAEAAAYIIETAVKTAASIKDKTSEAVIKQMTEIRKQNRKDCRGSHVCKRKEPPNL